MSFLKYARESRHSQGPPLSYSRAETDGMPFRGSSAYLRDEEYEALTEVVNDGYLDVFDLSKAEDKARINEIIDKAANGWYQLSKLDHKFIVMPNGDYKVIVYCVWIVPHKELAQHRLPPGMMTQR